MHDIDERDPVAEPSNSRSSLDWHLRLLFVISGASLQLPSLALLSITNDRAAMPPAYLLIYSALSFLPYSLKPVYAIITRKTSSRWRLLTILLIANGLSYLLTDWFATGVISCCLFGFIRGVTGAWPAFVLGLFLIEQAQASENFKESSARFASQATTMRNVGSLATSAFLVVLLWWTQSKSGMPPILVTILMSCTAVINVGGAVLAFHRQVVEVDYTEVSSFLDDSATPAEMRSRYQACNISGHEADPVARTSESFSDSSHKWDALSLGAFQLLLVFTALKSPISSFATTWAWFGLSLVTVLGFVAFQFRSNRIIEHSANQGLLGSIPTKQLALYLLLRHSFPTSSFLMYSYVYSVFESEPFFVQCLSVVEFAVSAVGTYCYERFLAGFHSGWRLTAVIACTSVLAGMISLLDIVLVKHTHAGGSVTMKTKLIASIVSIATFFATTVAFMPSVVLATSNVLSKTEPHVHSRPSPTEDGDSSHEELIPVQVQLAEEDEFPGGRGSEDYLFDDEGMQYAAYLSCIDFGSQVGNWLAVPIITALNVSRDNGWHNLDKFVLICAAGRIASILFLPIIQPMKRGHHINSQIE